MCISKRSVIIERIFIILEAKEVNVVFDSDCFSDFASGITGLKSPFGLEGFVKSSLHSGFFLLTLGVGSNDINVKL
jgi:hypothetical protein